MTDNLIYVLIGLGIILVIVLFFLRRQKQQAVLPPTTTTTPVVDKPTDIPVSQPPQKITSQSPSTSSEERLNIAKKYIAQKKYDDAQVLLSQGLADEPNNGKYMLEMLNIYALTTQLEKFDAMYKTIQTQADMVTLKQAKDIKQEYAQAFAESIEEPKVSSSSKIDEEEIISIDEDLVFDFERELKSELDTATKDAMKDSNDDSEMTLEIDDEISLNTDSQVDTKEESEQAQNDLLTFDELDDQSLNSPSFENLTIIEDQEYDDVDIDTHESVLDDEFNFDDASDVSFDKGFIEEDVSDLANNGDHESTFTQNDTKDSSTTESQQDELYSFDLDLSDTQDEPSQSTEQDLISEDTLDFFDNMMLEDTDDDTKLESNDDKTFDVTDSDDSTESDDTSSNDAFNFELFKDERNESEDNSTQIDPQQLESELEDVSEDIDISSTKDKDTIFNDSVTDTISQLDTLDFDFENDETLTASHEVKEVQPVAEDKDKSQKIGILSQEKQASSAQNPASLATEEKRSTQAISPSSEAVSHTLKHVDDNFAQAFDFVEQLDQSQITLDLAEQYLDLGEYDSAKRLVNEVLTSATDEQHKAHAQTLLDRMH